MLSVRLGGQEEAARASRGARGQPEAGPSKTEAIPLPRSTAEGVCTHVEQGLMLKGSQNSRILLKGCSDFYSEMQNALREGTRRFLNECNGSKA